jgi:hypothetical protein
MIDCTIIFVGDNSDYRSLLKSDNKYLCLKMRGKHFLYGIICHLILQCFYLVIATIIRMTLINHQFQLVVEEKGEEPKPFQGFINFWK